MSNFKIHDPLNNYANETTNDLIKTDIFNIPETLLMIESKIRNITFSLPIGIKDINIEYIINPKEHFEIILNTSKNYLILR